MLKGVVCKKCMASNGKITQYVTFKKMYLQHANHVSVAPHTALSVACCHKLLQALWITGCLTFLTLKDLAMTLKTVLTKAETKPGGWRPFVYKLTHFSPALFWHGRHAINAPSAQLPGSRSSKQTYKQKSHWRHCPRGALDCWLVLATQILLTVISAAAVHSDIFAGECHLRQH